MMKFMTICLGLLLYQTTYATGSEIRRGGYGVKLDSVLYSLDLAENAAAVDPNLELRNSVPLSDEAAKSLSRIASGMSLATRRPELLKILTNQFAEMKGTLLRLGSDYPIDEVIVYGSHYQWISQNIPCLNIHDESSTRFPELTQLAYRTNDYIRFCKDADTLDDANYAALIMHEIIYAAQTEKSRTKELVALPFSNMKFDLEGSREYILELTQAMEKVLKPAVLRRVNPKAVLGIEPGVYCATGESVCSTTILDVEFDDDGNLKRFKIKHADLPTSSDFECNGTNICREEIIPKRLYNEIEILEYQRFTERRPRHAARTFTKVKR